MLKLAGVVYVGSSENDECVMTSRFEVPGDQRLAMQESVLFVPGKEHVFVLLVYNGQDHFLGEAVWQPMKQLRTDGFQVAISYGREMINVYAIPSTETVFVKKGKRNKRVSNMRLLVMLPYEYEEYVRSMCAPVQKEEHDVSATEGNDQASELEEAVYYPERPC